MLPGTSERVPFHTDRAINDRIRLETEARLAACANNPEEIERRLYELEREWDIERTLEVNGSVLALTGLVLGATSSRKWFLLPAAVVGFCLQHALQGWCPPLPLFRRLGIRTQREIDEERYALKALRGDFADLPRSEEDPAHGDGMRAVLARMKS
jgi:hypothetical protein